MLAKVNVTYVHAAIRQAANRLDIEAGLLPLMPPCAAKPKAPASDLELFDFVRINGINRVFDVVCAIEAAQ